LIDHHVISSGTKPHIMLRNLRYRNLVNLAAKLVPGASQTGSQCLAGFNSTRGFASSFQEEYKGIEDSTQTITEEAEERQLTELILSFKISVPVVTAKLSNKSDSDVVVNLFMDFQGLANQNVVLRRRNRDLLNQLTVSGPNYSKIKEELEGKFEKYKIQIERENLLKDVENQKNINELRRQNADLMAENESLKAINQAMASKIEALETIVAKLNKKAEDVEFQNYIADVFRYIRDGIVAKNTSPTFPKGSDCMSLLYSSPDLEFPDQDDFGESEVDEWNAAIAEVNKKNADYGKASTFLTGLGLDASLVRDLRVFNKARNDDTNDEECKLKAKFKVTSNKNQAALKELRTTLQRLDEGHAAFPLKARLIAWCNSVIVN
jgi:hypothetical protein